MPNYKTCENGQHFKKKVIVLAVRSVMRRNLTQGRQEERWKGKE